MQYSYTKSPVAVDRLTKEIRDSAITAALDYITLLGSSLDIFFKATLSEGEITTLAAIVTAHTGAPLPQNVVSPVDVQIIPAFGAKTFLFNNEVKKLYARNTGIQQALTAGSNVITYTLTYPWVKMIGVEVINAEALDYVDLKIKDTASGTYSGIANYVLNQFAFNHNLPKDYYLRTASFDADLYQGMVIELTYNSVSAKRVGINLIMSEVKA